MIKALTLAATLVAVTTTVTTAQSGPPRIQMPPQGLQLGPQIKTDTHIPEVPSQDRVHAAPDTPQAARGYYRNSEGKFELYRGCHWVDPNDNSDLRT